LAKRKARIVGSADRTSYCMPALIREFKGQDEGQAPERQHDFPPKMEKHGKDPHILTQFFRCVGTERRVAR